MNRPELHRLSVPFPDKFVQKKEGADYVNHAIVQQRLLGTVGPFSQRIDHIIRGPYDERVTGRGDRQRTWPARDDAIVGAVVTCTFTIDGREVEVSEVGTPEGYYMKDHDGDRLKTAVSDAIKRCAMRVGVALDLWSKGAYFLPKMLEREVDPQTGEIRAPRPDYNKPDPDEARGSDLEEDGWKTARGVDTSSTSTTNPTEQEPPSDPGGAPTADAAEQDIVDAEIVEEPEWDSSDTAKHGTGSATEKATRPKRSSSADEKAATTATTSTSATASGGRTTPTDRPNAMKAFHARLRDLELDYGKQVRPWLEANMGASLSKLPADKQEKLLREALNRPEDFKAAIVAQEQT